MRHGPIKSWFKLDFADNPSIFPSHSRRDARHFFKMHTIKIWFFHLKADLIVEPKEANYKQNEKIVIKCSATPKPIQKRNRQTSIRKNFVLDFNYNIPSRQHRMPRPHIYWFKDNEILKDTDLSKNKIRQDSSQTRQLSHLNQRKINITTSQDLNENSLNSVLTIENANVNDSGKYKCIYENIHEQVTVNVRRTIRKIYFILFIPLPRWYSIRVYPYILP